MSVIRRTALAAVVALAAAAPARAGESRVVWEKSLSDAYRKSVAENKPMLMCFTNSSPFAAKQRQLFADGALDPFHDRAVFVYADPENDDRFENARKKAAELGVRQFPTMVLLTPGKLEEVGRIEGSKPRDEIQRELLKLLEVPATEWVTLDWEKPTWAEDLAKAYDSAAAARVPVALVFLSPGCQPGKDCACVKYARDLVPSAAFRVFAARAVFVLAEIPPQGAKVSREAADRADHFRVGWNVSLLPTLIVADPTAGGVRERARIVGRFDPELYHPRMEEAFAPKAETKLLMKAGTKPATADDLTRFLADRKVPFERTADGGFRTTVRVADASGGTTELPAELRVTEDTRRVVLTVTAADLPGDAAAQARFAETVAKARRLLPTGGTLQVRTDGGVVRVTAELFNDLSNEGVLAHHLLQAGNTARDVKLLVGQAAAGKN